MKNSILQVRIDSDLKDEAEALYASMGTSLSEAVRIFLKQSILEQKLPFTIKSISGKGTNSAFGILNLYVHPSFREQEREAWISSLSRKR